MVSIQQQLRETTDDDPPSTTDAHPVPLLFDHALAVPAIPDHLVFILISSLMAAFFKSMDNNHMRRVIEMCLVNAASSNGLEAKHHIAAWERSTAVSYTHLTLPTIYSV